MRAFSFLLSPLLALGLACVPSRAHGQARDDLGTLLIRVPERPRVSVFTIVSRPPLPDLPAGAVSAAVEAPLRLYRAAVGAARAAMRRRSHGERTSPAVLDALIAAEREPRASLIAAIEAELPGASAPARVFLGWLRYERAALALLDACESSPSTCPEVLAPDGGAMETWRSVALDEPWAAHAQLQLAWSLVEHGRLDDAMPLLRAAARDPALPALARARAAYSLAESTPAAAESAQEYARTAALTTDELSQHAALRGAERYLALGQLEAALRLLDPLLTAAPRSGDGPDLVLTDARLLLGDAVAQLGARAPTTLPSSLSPAARARALLLAAERFADAGILRWAEQSIAAAARLDPQADTSAVRTRVAELRASATETPRAWLVRAATYCAGVATPQSPRDVRVTMQLSRARPPRVRTRDAPAEFERCLLRDAPPAEQPVEGRASAILRFVFRT